MAARQISHQQLVDDTVHRLLETGTLICAIDKEVVICFKELSDLRNEAQFSFLHSLIRASGHRPSDGPVYQVTNFHNKHQLISEDVAKLLHITFASAANAVDQDTAARSIEATARFLQKVKISTRQLHAHLDIYWQGCTALNEFLLEARNIGPNEAQERSNARLFIQRFHLNVFCYIVRFALSDCRRFQFCGRPFNNGFLVLPDERTSMLGDDFEGSNIDEDTNSLGGLMNENPDSGSAYSSNNDPDNNKRMLRLRIA
ncbi:hypothetical protein CPB85DRAFT_1258598 [Mucidula mucida]|nr:hypothetical protein CPB85DRAFT_1258598 [Mucidula mucida]